MTAICVELKPVPAGAKQTKSGRLTTLKALSLPPFSTLDGERARPSKDGRPQTRAAHRVARNELRLDLTEDRQFVV